MVVTKSLDSIGRHLHIGMCHVAFTVQRIVPLLDAVTPQHHSPGIRRFPVYHAQKALHVVVADRFVGKEFCSFGNKYIHYLYLQFDYLRFIIFNLSICDLQLAPSFLYVAILTLMPSDVLQWPGEIEKQLTKGRYQEEH